MGLSAASSCQSTPLSAPLPSILWSMCPTICSAPIVTRPLVDAARVFSQRQWMGVKFPVACHLSYHGHQAYVMPSIDSSRAPSSLGHWLDSFRFPCYNRR